MPEPRNPQATRAVTVAVEIDPLRLDRYEDKYLAMLWHVAQANPAEHGDRAAGELASAIGYEIIRRWLAAVPPELYRHQARDYYWDQLRRLGKWDLDGQFVPDAARDEADTPAADSPETDHATSAAGTTTALPGER